MNITTRKHPRTLGEAFGPYERGPIHDPFDAWSSLWRTTVTRAALGVVWIAAIFWMASNSF